MNDYILRVLIGLILVTPSLVGQTNATAPTPIPEEARRHFVMGETMFKEAKNVDAFTQAVSEFTEAARLAPQWPDARYDLALAKEAAGDYPGAMADLKLYQQFKLTDAEARNVQDKIYAIEAKQKMATSDTKARAEKRETQEMVDAQQNFPDLIARLTGSVFIAEGSSPDDGTDEIYFLRNPFQNPGEDLHYNSPISYLFCQKSYLDDGKRGFRFAVGVRPTSNSEFDQHLPGF